MFEISLVVRNSLGEEVRDGHGNLKRANFKSESAYAIWEFWQRNSVIKPKGKKKKKNKKDKHTTKEVTITTLNNSENFEKFRKRLPLD